MPTQLTMASVPGFFDLPNTAIQADEPLTDDAIVKISENAKFAALRVEHFQGYYKHGETVALPVSPADGYTYARSELRYTWSLYSPLNPVGATNGADDAPALDGESMQVAGGPLDSWEWIQAWVDHKNAPDNPPSSSPGLVHVQIRVNDGTTTILKNQGVLYVTTIAERLGVAL